MNLLLFLLLAGAGLATLHSWVLVQVWPLEPTINGGLLLANVFCLANWWLVYRLGGAAERVGFFFGYAVLVLLLWPLLRVLSENALVGLLTVMLYGGLYTRPFLVGYLFLLVAASVYAAAYVWPAFLLSSLLYTGLWPMLSLQHTEHNPLLPACLAAGAVLLFGLLLPVVYFCAQPSGQTLIKTAALPEVQAALWLSLWTATTSVIGTALLAVPLAYVMVRADFPGRGILNALVDIPLLIPPPVAGVALLALLGDKSPVGEQLYDWFGVRFVSAVPGIIAVQVFVGSPFLIRSAMIAFAGVDPHYERVARTLGASAGVAFWRISLPLAWPGILLGAVLMWFRAVGEFGATFLFSPSPETAPMIVWKTFQSRGPIESQPIAVLIIVLFVSLFAALSALRHVAARRTAEPVE